MISLSPWVLLLAAGCTEAMQNDGKVLAEIGAHSHLVRREVTDPSKKTQATTSKQAEAEAEASSNAYAKAVLGSKPVAYWQLNELTGNRADGQGPACGQDGGVAFGDLCDVAGSIHGSPKLGAESLISSAQDKAIEFSGKANEEIVIPDSVYINANKTGYSARTVELWFQAGDPGNINRVIYEEGNAPHSGLNMYIADSGADKATHLHMYAWDRGNVDIEFGTALISPSPIKCAIQKQKPYYAALVFSQANRSLTGYLRKPGSDKLEMCGQLLDLPASVTLGHHGHMDGNAIIGGVFGTSRASGTSIMDGNSHNFIGTIDDVAIYNRVLAESELQAHVAAAGQTSEKAATAAAKPDETTKAPPSAVKKPPVTTTKKEASTTQKPSPATAAKADKAAAQK